jgi:hypothetical protein
MRSRFAMPLVLTAALVLVADLGARAAFFVRDRVKGFDYRVHADALASAPWRTRYFEELRSSSEAEWHPYVAWRSRPYAGEYINIDARGVRRTWNPPVCGANPQRSSVWMFGGSTMWGVGARDEFTIPSDVSRTLANDRARGICVANLGELGYVTSQELILLLNELRAGARPRLAIFYDGDNDAYAAFQEGIAGAPQNEVHRRQEFNLSTRPGQMLLLSAADEMRRSGLYRAAESAGEHLLHGERQPKPHADADLAREVVAAYANNVRLVEVLADAYHFDTLFYWQPLVFDKRHATAYEQSEARRDASFGRFWALVERAIRAEPALARDARFHDLSDIFAETTMPLFLDFAHVSEAGSAAVAARVARDATAALDGEAIAAR